jgi:hypothetical protein
LPEAAEKDVENTSLQVTFLTQGSLNRLYKVTASYFTYVMRVALPLDPFFKAKSETATLD